MKALHQPPYKVALVGLDLSEMDEHLINYAAMISRIFPLERIFFVHVAKELELPKEVLQKYPDLMAPLDEGIENDIRKKVNQHFGSSGTETNVVVKEGHPIEELLKFSRIKNSDLILMGRKVNLKGSGLIPGHIARKCPCSLILVTETFSSPIRKLLVPVDFSGHSGLAMNQALVIAEKTNADVVMSHVYNVPSGYYKTGKSYEEFAAIMKGHAEKACSRFLSQHNMSGNFTCEYLLAKEEGHADRIYSYAKESNVDLLVLGSRGRTEASAVIIGSMAEKIANLDRHIPILIVKNKGENMSFLEALMKV